MLIIIRTVPLPAEDLDGAGGTPLPRRARFTWSRIDDPRTSAPASSPGRDGVSEIAARAPRRGASGAIAS